MLQTTHQRVQKHRNYLRSMGLRPIQIWVPDTRSAGFATECRRQSQTLRTEHEQEILAWLDNVADREGWI